MTATAYRIVPQPAGERCARCADTELVLTPDAVGRLRKRCPKCDGVSLKRVRHPDELMMPQALVQVNERPALPAIAPGQLRCQVCAHGVEGSARFCATCSSDRQRPECVPALRTCLGCGATSPRPRHGRTTTASCDACKRPETRICLGCGAVGPRAKHGHSTVEQCRSCPRLHRSEIAWKSKPCKAAECGVVFQPRGPNGQYCEAHR